VVGAPLLMGTKPGYNAIVFSFAESQESGPRSRKWTPQSAQVSARHAATTQSATRNACERSRISVTLVPLRHGAVDDGNRLVGPHQHHRPRSVLQHAPLHQHVHDAMAGQPRPDVATRQTILQLPVAQQLCQERRDKIVVPCRALTISASKKTAQDGRSLTFPRHHAHLLVPPRQARQAHPLHSSRRNWRPK
jgi:hypothetical protein